MGDRPAERITLAGSLSAGQAPAKAALPPGIQAAALHELKVAATTFDFLRASGDPVEFWETLRMARNRRGLTPQEGGALAVPTPQEEELILQDLGSVRGALADLVGAVRDLLQGAKELPQPAERLEMALAFLMASSREHEAVAQWLKEPDKHLDRAAAKLRSLAAITDPYRQALLPWSLGAAL